MFQFFHFGRRYTKPQRSSKLSRPCELPNQIFRSIGQHHSTTARPHQERHSIHMGTCTPPRVPASQGRDDINGSALILRPKRQNHHAERSRSGPATARATGVLCLESTYVRIEKNYSNIERETLGVVWGLERFNYFIFGKH